MTEIQVSIESLHKLGASCREGGGGKKGLGL